MARRPLPGRFDHRLPIGQYTAREGPIWPLTLPSDFGVPTSILVGTTRHLLSRASFLPPSNRTADLSSPAPPENYLFRVRENSANPDSLDGLMPFMLFRYQLPSERFPDARPNIVQCTPLLDRMSWRRVDDPKQGLFYQLNDPWFDIVSLSFGNSGLPLPVANGWSDDDPPTVHTLTNIDPLPPYLRDATGLILLNDPLPVTIGARYRHLIVQYDDRGEIKRVIPLEPVQH